MVKHLTGEQVRRLMVFLREDARRNGSVWRVRRWMALELALLTGLRVSEVAALHWDDIRLDSDGGWVLVRRGKGGRSRAVRFGGRLAAALLQYRRITGDGGYLFPGRASGHISPRTLQLWLKGALAEAGLPRDFTFHSLRHTYATTLYIRSNHNLRLVQRQLGHADMRSTQLYTAVDPTAYDAVFDSLY